MSFYTDTITKDGRFDSIVRISGIGLLEPTTLANVQNIITSARQMGIGLMVYETYRSQQRQEALFNQGATRLKSVGVHHYGLACDIVRSIAGEPSWKGDFTFLRQLAQDNGMIWGGDWGAPRLTHSFVDNVHVQRCTVARQASLFSGAWYPDSTYNPYSD